MVRHLSYVLEVMSAHLPKVTVRRLPDADRWTVIDPLAPKGNVGIELGVAAGSFSARMVQSGRFTRFYGVDAYLGGHSVSEYKSALRATGLWSDYRLLRMGFSQAVDLFPDSSFDFIYVDGYAHSGCEGGRTLAEWFPKLKVGGIMAGDDYDPVTWPLVVWAVHEAVAQLGVELRITTQVSDRPYNRHPSWSFVRPVLGPQTLNFSAGLRQIADAEKARIDAIRARNRQERRKATRPD